MSQWQRNRSAIGISPTAVALVLAERTGGAVKFYEHHYGTGGRQFVATDDGNSNHLSAAFATLVEKSAASGGKESIPVIITDNLARYFVMSPPDGASSLSELKAVARARFEEIYERPADAWRHAADWRSNGSIVCCSIPERIIGPVESLQGSKLRNAPSTLIATVLRKIHRTLPDYCWLCIHLNEYVVLMQFSQGRVQSIRNISVGLGTNEQSAELAATEMLRETVRLNLKNNCPAFWLEAAPSSITADSFTTSSGVRYQRLTIAPSVNQLPKELLTSDAGVAAWLGVQ